MGNSTYSAEHLLLSMYVVLLLVDLATGYRNKIRHKIKYFYEVSYASCFYTEHRWTFVGIVGFYVMMNIFSYFFQ